MSWLDAFAAGAGNLFSWPGILIPVAGTLLAMIASFLPGIGNTSIAVLVIAATVTWDVESVLLMFGALTGGATFMGSITAILFNVPGNVSSTATLFDGHPMARQGFARTAIASAATASAIGSVFGVLVLLAILPVVRPFVLQFGPLERVLVAAWGLLTVVSIPTQSRLKSAAMVALGLAAACVGTDPGTGATRWTGGMLELTQGFHVIAVMLGMFTFAELIDWMRTVGLQRVDAPPAAQDSVRNGIRAVLRNLPLTLRCSSIGTLVGVVPGVGGTVAGLVAYGHAVQSARDKDGFGRGDVRGVIGPEAAIDAKDGGSLLPAVAFGLPGSEAGVALLTVFAIHGLQPGVPMLDAQLALTFTLVLALLFSNLLTSAVGLAMVPLLARLRDLPIERVALPALFVSLITVMQVNGHLFDVYTAAAFGIAGYFWRAHGWPRAPFVIAFVLGSLLETNLTLTLQLVEMGRIQPLERAPSVVLAVLILATLAWLWRRRARKPHAHTESAQDLPLALLTAAGAAALFVAGLVATPVHSAYALGCAGSACLLACAVGWRAARLSFACDAAQRRSAWAAGLLPPSGHRLALVLVAGLPFAIWLFGLVPGVMASVAAFTLAREGLTWRSVLRAGAAAAVYGLLTYVFADHVAELSLPDGVLRTLLTR